MYHDCTNVILIWIRTSNRTSKTVVTGLCGLTPISLAFHASNHCTRNASQLGDGPLIYRTWRYWRQLYTVYHCLVVQISRGFAIIFKIVSTQHPSLTQSSLNCCITFCNHGNVGWGKVFFVYTSSRDRSAWPLSSRLICETDRNYADDE